MSNQEIIELIDELPRDARQELERFAEVLQQRTHVPRVRSHYSFDWAGGLKEYRDQYTSVELQEKASAWRLDS
jgi:hypothetical protein